MASRRVRLLAAWRPLVVAAAAAASIFSVDAGGASAVGSGIFSVRLDGSAVVALASGHGERDPVRAPGRRLVGFLRDGDIWLMSDDGSQQRPLVTTRDPEAEVRWSGDARYVTYSVCGSGFACPYAVRVKPVGGGAAKDVPIVGFHPSLSIHAGLIAYRGYTRGEPTAIVVARANGADRRVVGTGFGAPVWSPRTLAIAYVGRCAGRLAVCVVDPAGHRRRALFRLPDSSDCPPACTETPVWCGNGAALLVQRRSDTGTSVWSVAARSGKARRMSSGASVVGHSAACAPGAARIAFVNTPVDEASPDSLVLVDTRTNRRRTVLAAPNGSLSGVTFSADGRRLLFARDR